MISKSNVDLLHIFSVISGTACFLINAKDVFHFPLFLIGLILMILPILYRILFHEKYDLNSLTTLFLMMYPIIFVNYIFFLTQGTVVGFQDPHVPYHKDREPSR